MKKKRFSCETDQKHRILIKTQLCKLKKNDFFNQNSALQAARGTSIASVLQGVCIPSRRIEVGDSSAAKARVNRTKTFILVLRTETCITGIEGDKARLLGIDSVLCIKQIIVRFCVS